MRREPEIAYSTNKKLAVKWFNETLQMNDSFSIVIVSPSGLLGQAI